MAKVQNPVIGRTRGSAGGMTWSKVYDKNVMKAKIFEASNPNTVAQQNQRQYFKAVSVQTAYLNVEQLVALFPNKPKGLSRRNAFFKQLAEYTQVVEGEKQMKLADLLTVGNAQTMDMGTTTCSISSGTISVGLDAAVKTNDLVNSYYFIAMVVNDTKNEIYLDNTNAIVSTGLLSITAPANWEDADTIHAIPLITNSKVAVTGFGTVSVAKRPARS